MNSEILSEQETELLLKRRLEEILADVPWLRDWKVSQNPAPYERAFDLRAHGKLPSGNEAELYVECKNFPRPSQFPFVNLRNRFEEDGTRHTIVPVLAAPWISPRMAELCKQHGWSWFDLAGNCRLNVPDGLYIERIGFEPVHKRPKPEANLSTVESARVIRALLSPHEAARNWTQQSLKDECAPRVSIGLVNKIVRYLREQAYLADIPKNAGFKLHDPLGLLREWKQAYRFDRHQRCGYFTLLRPLELREALVPLDSLTGGRAAFATFSAADQQAPHVHDPKTWIYVNRRFEEMFADKAEAKPVETGANIVVLFPEDDGVFFMRTAGPGGGLPCTNPVQTYVDLCHVGGRGEEAAEALLEQRLIPRWKEAGLAW